MLRVQLTVLVLSLLTTLAAAQTKIGGNPVFINAEAYLELGDSIGANKGLLMPRVALSSAILSNPLRVHVAGMVVYNTAKSGFAPNEVLPGIYYDDGSRWLRLNPMSGGAFLKLEDSTTLYITPSQMAAALRQKLSIADTALMLERYLNHAFNGLSRIGQSVTLGGALVHPTTIQTSSNAPLSITGMSNGTRMDSMLVSETGTGILKRISVSALLSSAKMIYAASAGQTLFTVLRPITDINKINLFRNGIRLEIVQAGTNSVQLEPGVVCDANDEIRIIQLY